MTSDGEFNELVTTQRIVTAVTAKHLTAADLVSRGYVVSSPIMEHPKYDLIADTGDKLLKIHVKMGSKGSLQVMLAKQKTYEYDNNLSYVQRIVPKYVEGDFDYLAVVDRDTKDVYYLKWSDIDNTKTSLSLKLTDRDQFRDI